ncbi:putative D-amino acid oxidase PA4548 isoform X1 [Cinnamomum micranthum f. kanehirae]|uniref:FAD-dependent oxidoreductase domain-containing protein 1 n=1 Tax=Cinnamomum micranthum f. kanehirae TaxID=337451 RepID=A0A443NNN4_9MAGN|nr:putative D-amino acid oxidase PA4548 isoform X1 [Cinnamomum micranthum f. kanehirae]
MWPPSGSSRQFTGFSTDVEESIINRIWERAGVFFPTLRELSLPNFVRSRKIRVGLRPYMIDGKPLIGPIPGIPKVFLATGHEGEGLCTGYGWADFDGGDGDGLVRLRVGGIVGMGRVWEFGQRNCVRLSVGELNYN